MLYGFEHAGTVVIYGADRAVQLPHLLKNLQKSGVEMMTAEVEDILGDPILSQFSVPLHIVSRGDLDPTKVVIEAWGDALNRSERMSEEDRNLDLDDQMIALFNLTVEGQNTAAQRQRTSTMLDADEIGLVVGFSPNDLAFAVLNDGEDTRIAVVSVSFFDEHSSLVSMVYEEDHRIGHLFDMPPCEEVLPGVFVYQGDPLAARKEMLLRGYWESKEVFDLLLEGLNADPFAASATDTLVALGLSGASPEEFSYSVKAHPIKPSSLCIICPTVLCQTIDDMPETVFISPLLRFLPSGYHEIRPCFFERVKQSADVKGELTAVGMRENKLLAELFVGDIDTPAPAAPKIDISHPAVDLDDLAKRWAGLSEDERRILLPEKAIYFAIIEDSQGTPLVFFCPREHYDTTNDLYDFDLEIGNRLPRNAEKVAPNIYRLTGTRTADAIEYMNRAHFVESMAMILEINMKIAIGEISLESGLRPS